MKIAVMGCGKIAHVTWGPHLAAARERLKGRGESLELLFCDPNQAAAEELASKHDGVACDGGQALGSSPDGVVIATPPQLHTRLAIKALEAGAHVVIEKPFALNAPDAVDVVHAARNAERTISMPYHQLLMAKGPLDQIAAGLIGDVQIIDYVWRRRAPHPVRPLADVGSHAIAMAAQLAGWPGNYGASAVAHGGVDLLTVRLGDALLRARLEFGAPIAVPEEVSVRVTGSEGEVLIPLRTTATPKGVYRPEVVRAGEREWLNDVDGVDMVRMLQVNTWVDSLRGGEPLPVDGLRGVYIQLIEDAAKH